MQPVNTQAQPQNQARVSKPFNRDQSITPELWQELRSDHAGEYGAVFIYRGVLAFSRHPVAREFAQRHLVTETTHLQLVEQWVPPNKRSLLLPIWRIAGWLTGALPALFGPKAVFATIEAVETFVDLHYQAQLDLIDALPADPVRTQLRQLLAQCQSDEVEHRDEAATLVGASNTGWIATAWGFCVGHGSSLAVQFAKRI